jgi:hypothetical protein
MMRQPAPPGASFPTHLTERSHGKPLRPLYVCRLGKLPSSEEVEDGFCDQLIDA